MIRNATDEDFDQLYEVINDAAMAYKGVIPEDRWHEPYMTKEELREQLQNGVKFLCYVENRAIVGVMGIQDREEVNLIRHAYVRTERRRNGIGTLLLDRLARESDKPVLIGTWKAASWAISKNVFRARRIISKTRICFTARRTKSRVVEEILEHSRTAGGDVRGVGG